MGWDHRLAPPAPVTLATIVYIPELEGYWSESLEILRLFLASLERTVHEPCELLVLDNGSCTQVRELLVERHASDAIDQLFLTRRNLGKVGGWNLLFSAARGEMVAYSDSDVLFLPGWLERSKAVLEAFPEAAMVTAQPIPGDLSRHCAATLKGADADPATECREGNDLIPPHYVESHRLGLGESPQRYAARIERRRDVRLRRGEVEAYVSASHFQFLGRRDALASFFPLPTRIPLGDDVVLDDRLDAAGYWRLSTVDYLVHHMGNRLPDVARELPWLNNADEVGSLDVRGRSRKTYARGLRQRLAESPRVRRWLKALHRKCYQLLYPD